MFYSISIVKIFCDCRVDVCYFVADDPRGNANETWIMRRKNVLPDKVKKRALQTSIRRRILVGQENQEKSENCCWKEPWCSKGLNVLSFTLKQNMVNKFQWEITVLVNRLVKTYLTEKGSRAPVFLQWKCPKLSISSFTRVKPLFPSEET